MLLRRTCWFSLVFQLFVCPPLKSWKPTDIYKQLFDARYFIIRKWRTLMQIIIQLAVKWMTVTNSHMGPHGLKQNSSSPKISPQMKLMELFPKTCELIITHIRWPMSLPPSMDMTQVETLHVLWCQLIHVSKRLLIRSQVHIYTDSILTISCCCLKCCMLEPISLYSGF